jgi:hypothetical protein
VVALLSAVYRKAVELCAQLHTVWPVYREAVELCALPRLIGGCNSCLLYIGRLWSCVHSSTQCGLYIGRLWSCLHCPDLVVAILSAVNRWLHSCLLYIVLRGRFPLFFVCIRSSLFSFVPLGYRSIVSFICLSLSGSLSYWLMTVFIFDCVRI